MPVVVQKYGGSSLATAEKIRVVAGKICARRSSGVDLVVVVSAMGDTTDDLIALARLASGPSHVPDPREMDTLLSTGELVTATLMAIAIRSMGHDVVSLSGPQAGVRTDSRHGSARIADIDTTRLKRELGSGKIVIVAGFQGLAETEDVTTLGRGGSDTTAVAIAAGLKASRCEIFTDVDGIYTTDPRLVPDARKLREIGYEEMLELASLGAKMNPRSIELGAVYDVEILVASTFEDKPGTLIHGESRMMEVRKAVTGVAVTRNVGKIMVRGVEDRPGVAAEIFEPLAEAGISVDVIVQNAGADGKADISFTVAEGDLDRALAITERCQSCSAGGVTGGRGFSKVSIVGTGMTNSPGYAARMFRALSAAGVNIDMITTSEIRITCIIDAPLVEKAARSLHRAFGLHEASAG
ncbi:MAG: aspartate kinase [SAR202 cluster bacterium]|nr:aspartate kinase [SAR202 cluster bacterium]